MEVVIGLIVIGAIVYFLFFRGGSANVDQYRENIEEMILISMDSDKPVQTTTIPVKVFMAYAKQQRNVHLDMHSMRGTIIHYCTATINIDEYRQVTCLVRLIYQKGTVIVRAVDADAPQT